MTKLERYKAGAEVPLRAKLRLMGLPEPEFIQENPRAKELVQRWYWVPFHKLRYANRRALWVEFNAEVNRLIAKEEKGLV